MRSPKLVLAGLVVLLIMMSIAATASAITAEVVLDPGTEGETTCPAVVVSGSTIGGIPFAVTDPGEGNEGLESPLVFIIDNGSNTLAISGPLVDSGQTIEVGEGEILTVYVGTTPATCGDIAIDSAAPGSFPQISAQVSGSASQLILTNVVVINSSFDAPHTITIRYNHLFTGVNTGEERFYGLSASGSFFRPPFDLASEDSFTFTSFVGYPAIPEPELIAVTNQSFVEEQIGVLEYQVPFAGSVSLNDFSPQNPRQIIRGIACTDLSGAQCSSTESEFPGQETIRTETSFRLATGDAIILVGSVHTAACIDQDTCVQLLSRLGVRIDPKPGNSPNFFGPHDKGAYIVDLLGSPATEISGVTIPAFDVTTVDLGSVAFGPACAIPGATLNCGAHPTHASFIDANHDGIRDVRLHFRNPEIGWNPNCDPIQRTATLKGSLKGVDDSEFVATASVVCLPPKKK